MGLHYVTTEKGATTNMHASVHTFIGLNCIKIEYKEYELHLKLMTTGHGQALVADKIL